MPAVITAACCQVCNEDVSKMSLYERICESCYDRYFTVCADCGRLLRQQNVCDLSLFTCRYEAGRAMAGDTLCWECSYGRERGDQSVWRPEPLHESVATYNIIGSTRKFGVEIETSSCPRRQELNGVTSFGCKSDCSVTGMEFDSPILYGDNGLQHIRDLLDFARRNNWRVDRNCGCHTHYDMRDETEESLWRICYAYRLTSPVWECCVSRERLGAAYCGGMTVSARAIRRSYEDATTFTNFCEGRERYNYINFRAYLDHKTIEIRLLEGQLDPDTICNWIKLHCRFIDKAKELDFPELRRRFANKTSQERFTALAALIADRELTSWLAQRIQREAGITFTRLPEAERVEPAETAQPATSFADVF